MHSINNINSFTLLGGYKIELVFDDSTIKVIDFSPILYGEMYGPLQDHKLFEKVFLDTEVHTIVWPNGADFDPALLYNWDNHISELSERVKQWNMAKI